MRPTVASVPKPTPRKFSAEAFAARETRGEADHKPLAIDVTTRLIGGAIETALRNAEITKKEASAVMGYGENQAPISNWISGKETPQFAKLWLLGDGFQHALVIALADLCKRVEVRTVVTLERARRGA